MTVSLYQAQADLSADYAFQQRIVAVVFNETSTWAEPPTSDPRSIAVQITPVVAASPGYAAKFVWGDEAGGIAPGQAAIGDADLLAAVQPLLEDYRPGSP